MVEQLERTSIRGRTLSAFDEHLGGDLDALGTLAQLSREVGLAHELAEVEAAMPARINADPDRVEQGLAKLVLTLIELLRRLLEKQAIRRIEAGTLSDEEIERMGETFMRLDTKMGELAATFGLAREDLNLKLGPLGDLM